MLNYYYDLHNEERLPIGARFVDPYDHEVFRTEPNETLPQFIKQITKSREDKKYPPLLETELKQLVVASLYESCKKELLATYFVKRVAVANLSQIVSVAKTIATELIHHTGAPSIKEKEQRALKCLDKCVFHRTNSSWGKRTTKLISSIMGLENLAQSEEEKSLGTCSMCGGCSLQEKVKFPLIPILAGLTPERLDLLIRAYKEKAFTKCWIMKEALENPVTKNLLRKRLQNGSANGVEYLEKHVTLQVKKAKQPIQPTQPNVASKVKNAA